VADPLFNTEAEASDSENLYANVRVGDSEEDVDSDYDSDATER
jgi:hypothetical protein